MYAAIHTFTGEAPQFDDITMLCLRYLGPSKEAGQSKSSLKVPARVDRLDDVTNFVQEQLAQVACPEDDLFVITLAAEEIFVNIAEYAYEGREGEAAVSFSYEEKEKTAEIVFTDSGMPFDPTRRAAPDISQKPGERQIGGFGIHIVRKTMDQVIYRYEAGRNVLTIRKKLV